MKEVMMHDAFRCLYCQFPEALIGGALIAVVFSLFGVFVILNRAVFIGITLSEVASCGVAASLMTGCPPLVGSTVFVLGAVSLLAAPLESKRIPRDTLMGVIFVAASAMTILLVSRSGSGLQEIQALLYGDLILTSQAELKTLLWILVPALLSFLLFIRPTLYTFLDRDSAKVLGIKVVIWELLFFILLGIIIAAASRIAGALLIFCYLVVCPATALVISKRMVPVLLIAPLTGLFGTWLGMSLSFKYDFPTNQTICVLSCILFACAALASWLRRKI
jgi:manganese/iron transport system permease protein